MWSRHRLDWILSGSVPVSTHSYCNRSACTFQQYQQCSKIPRAVAIYPIIQTFIYRVKVLFFLLLSHTKLSPRTLKLFMLCKNQTSIVTFKKVHSVRNSSYYNPNVVHLGSTLRLKDLQLAHCCQKNVFCIWMRHKYIFKLS